MPTRTKTPETRGKTGIQTPPETLFGHPTATRKGATGVGITGSRKCPTCGASVLNYEHDHNLGIQLSPARVDPTPIDPTIADAYRLTSRRIYTWHRDRTGHTHLSLIFPNQPTPTSGTIIPAHLCGARAPTHLPKHTTNTTPDTCPF